MDTESKIETNVKLEVIKILGTMPNILPEKIIEYANPLSEWILSRSQRLHSGIDDKE